MSPVNFFKVFAPILRLPLSATQKLVLCMILTFGDKGLGQGNRDIAEALNVSTHTVKNSLAELRRQELIITTKAKSKHRRIYPNSEALLAMLASQVDESYMTDIGTLLARFRDPTGYTDKSSPIQVQNYRNKRRAASDSRKKNTHNNNGTFDRFWAAYPKRVAKARAEKIWLKLRPSPELVETIMASIELHKGTDQWRKDGGRFIPHPTTWLNQRRWEDEDSLCDNTGASSFTHEATEEEVAWALGEVEGMACA